MSRVQTTIIVLGLLILLPTVNADHVPVFHEWGTIEDFPTACPEGQVARGIDETGTGADYGKFICVSSDVFWDDIIGIPDSCDDGFVLQSIAGAPPICVKNSPWDINVPFNQLIHQTFDVNITRQLIVNETVLNSTGIRFPFAANIESAGNLGVGTFDPLGALHVVDTNTLPNGILIERRGDSPRIGFLQTSDSLSATTAPVWYVDNSFDRFRIFRQPTFTTPGTEFFTIKNTGSVGVGTSSINDKLRFKVQGNLFAEQYCDANGENCKTLAELAIDTNAGTICDGESFLNGAGECKTIEDIIADVSADTNAGTLCDDGQYLDGDGTCKAIPVDTNATTECDDDLFLDGSGACKSAGEIVAAGNIETGAITNTKSKFLGKTSNDFTGKFTSSSLVGYQAGNNLCNTDFTGSHVCTADEIILTIATEDISNFRDTAWIAEGAPGFTANANDCVGWTSESNTDLGAFWEFDVIGGGKGWLTNCAQEKPIACCK